MKKLLIGLLLISTTACGAPVVDLPADQVFPTATLPSVATSPSNPQEREAEPDLFGAHDIVLMAPACDGTFVPEQTEGPYYTPGSPERNSLFEEGMSGERLYLVGYVLDENCQPVPGAWLDFWQADGDGNYDNVGYRLRGHQFTDTQGRYFLDTIIPAEYSGRPIAHIHLKFQAPGGNVITSQLYFPSEPVPGLTVLMEERGDHTVGYFNFVINTP